MDKQFKANFLLLLVAFAWGSTFVAQVVAMEGIGPFTFGFSRNFIGVIFLLPIMFYFKKKNKLLITTESNRRFLILGGLYSGLTLYIGSTFQQVGLQFTTAGKGGFITALYIVIVPIISVFFKKRISLLVWLSVAVSTLGLYLLTVKNGFSIEFGDLLVLFSAIAFAVHILIIDYYSNYADGFKLAMIQFVVTGILCFVTMLFTETPLVHGSKGFASLFIKNTPATWHSMFNNFISVFPAVLYAGLISTGVGYTLQMLVQKDTDPTIASLILSLEAVFSVICGFVFLNEIMTVKEIVGCGLMFGAIIVSQIYGKQTT